MVSVDSAGPLPESLTSNRIKKKGNFKVEIGGRCWGVSVSNWAGVRGRGVQISLVQCHRAYTTAWA